MIAHVYDLLPGDVVTSGERAATHIAHLAHPYYQDLQLVVWRLDDGTISLDALHIRQEVGELAPIKDWAERRQRLRHALTGEHLRAPDAHDG
jgi:hypothetical protein